MVTKRIILLWCCIVFLAVSCAQNPAPELKEGTPQKVVHFATVTPESVQNKIDNECISPSADFEFPMEPPRKIESLPSVLPPLEWQVQTSLPKSESKATIQLVQHQPSYDIVWIKSGDGYLLFHTDTKRWSNISFSKDTGVPRPYILFQDRSGQVWAFGSISSPRAVSPLFLRFNDKGQFEFVKDVDNELTTDWWGDQAPLIDKNGVFWMMLYNHLGKMALYSFDSNTQKAKLHLGGEVDEFGKSIAMGQDGSIFLVRPKEKVVVRYYPDSQTVEDIPAYYGLEGDLTEQSYPYLFVDRSGSLWIGDYAWIDFKNLDVQNYPTWHQIVRSPVFISKYGNLSLVFAWIRPRPMLESSDGRIWFDGGAAGLVWLDPQRGLWCKFTTIDSNILEDKDGNLWLLHDSNLYKYSITP